MWGSSLVAVYRHRDGAESIFMFAHIHAHATNAFSVKVTPEGHEYTSTKQRVCEHSITSASKSAQYSSETPLPN